jgi:hypothetical protein
MNLTHKYTSIQWEQNPLEARPFRHKSEANAEIAAYVAAGHDYNYLVFQDFKTGEYSILVRDDYENELGWI